MAGSFSTSLRGGARKNPGVRLQHNWRQGYQAREADFAACLGRNASLAKRAQKVNAHDDK
jgi:hypothetical protein